MANEIATFAAGCFWGVEAAFRQLPGVLDTAVGYTSGQTDAPSYEDVCTGTTGHAEAVQVEYDPTAIDYPQLLEAFWTCHDPTTVNRQGPDVGTQYRSAIFYHSPEQETAARASKTQQSESGRHRGEIVTEIYLANSYKMLDQLWTRARKAMTNLKVPPSIIDHVCEKKDVEVLAHNLREWTAQAKNK